jgi:predicted small metal-binding protein
LRAADYGVMFGPRTSSPPRAEVDMPEQRKHLRCRDVGLDCDYEMRGRSEEEVMQQAAAHAQRDHGIAEITPDLASRVRAAIRSE